jgi:pyridoxamine 5'-phosphate oxidase
VAYLVIVERDPIELFGEWQREAHRSGVPAGSTDRQRMSRVRGAAWRVVAWIAGGELPEANAATLATATPDGRPSARTVLVKGASDQGFVFYTSYLSRKAAELEANPRAALLFYWPWPPRQVRVEGRVERLDAGESDAYWRSRPRGSQLAAAASRQSAVVDARPTLLARVEQLEREYRGRDVPRPATWGGYRVVPEVMEFWQGRPDRLHDRIRYERAAPGEAWRTAILQP